LGSVLRYGGGRRGTLSPTRCRPPATNRRNAARSRGAWWRPLHTLQEVDWPTIGLDGFGKPSGYLERQLRRFNGLWEVNRTRDIPAVGRIGQWLHDNMPESAPATIVHGDYGWATRCSMSMLPPG